MSDLEKYIIENRQALSAESPRKGHVDRFRKKLPDNKTATARLSFRHYLQIAASIAVILASGVVIVKSSKGGSKMAAALEVQEFMDAKEYYATQVNEKYNTLSGFDFTSEREKKLLLEELQSMDTYYQELLLELKANPGDERVMSALIQHYQMKLDVMDQILEQLKSLKNSNNTQDNENADI
jgi:hypothetical protein